MPLSLGLKKDPFPVNPGELSRSFPREVRQVDIPTSTSLRWWPSPWVPGVVVTFTQVHLPRMTGAQAEVSTHEDNDVGR